MEGMLTVRLDENVKQRGTKVMAKLGITPSQAVRKLFDYAAAYDELPFTSSAKPSKNEICKRVEAFDRCHTLTPLTLTDDELREERLKERYGLDA